MLSFKFVKQGETFPALNKSGSLFHACYKCSINDSSISLRKWNKGWRIERLPTQRGEARNFTEVLSNSTGSEVMLMSPWGDSTGVL